MHIKADGARGWFKLSRELPLALSCLKLSGAAHSILWAVMLHSYGHPRGPRKGSKLTQRTLPGKVPGYTSRAIRDARDELLRRRILADGEEGYEINNVVSDWEGIDLQQFAALRAPFEHLLGGRYAEENFREEEAGSDATRKKTSTLAAENFREGSRYAEENFREEHRLEKEKEKNPPNPPCGHGLQNSVKENPASPEGKETYASENQRNDRRTKRALEGVISSESGRWWIRWGISELSRMGYVSLPDAREAIVALARNEGDALEPTPFADAIFALCETLQRGGAVQSLPGWLNQAYRAAIGGMGLEAFACSAPGKLWRLWREQDSAGRIDHTKLPPLDTGTREDRVPGRYCALAWWHNMPHEEHQAILERAEAEHWPDHDLVEALVRQPSPGSIKPHKILWDALETTWKQCGAPGGRGSTERLNRDTYALAGLLVRKDLADKGFAA